MYHPASALRLHHRWPLPSHLGSFGRITRRSDLLRFALQGSILGANDSSVMFRSDRLSTSSREVGHDVFG
jgi:hypothetical protein